MNKVLTNCDGPKFKNRVRAANKIINWAHFSIKEKYGSNNGDGITPLAFHNLNHSLNVYLATSLLYAAAYKKGKIPQISIVFLLISAALHDIEQKTKENEIASANIAEIKMREENIFSDDEIEIVRRLILGTKNYSLNGKFYQVAKDGDYLEKIIADADLAHLGASENYFNLCLQRHIEETYNGNKRPSGWEIYLNEANFLNSHEYLTVEAKEIFENKKINLIFCEEQANNFTRGRF